LINLEGQFIHILIQPFPSLALDLLQMIVYSLPVVLCGLMLGVAAGVGGRRAFLRIVVWTAAGGILGHLVTFPIRMFNTALVAWAGTHPQWESVAFGMLPFLAVMCTYGFFNGAGLGFAFGGWQACKKFALIGLAAYSVGSLAGNYISLITPRLVYLGDYLPANITWSVIGALAGGILGWFFGKEKQPGPDTAIQTGNV
jgi:MFS family permease